MSVLPTDPLYSKLLVTALKPNYKRIRDKIAAIVAMLSVENVYYTFQNLDSSNPRDKLKIKAIKNRKRFLVPNSDHLSLLAVYEQYKKAGRNSNSFCNEYLLNGKSIQKAGLIQN
jgi:HrpA-like RNA helicase